MMFHIDCRISPLITEMKGQKLRIHWIRRLGGGKDETLATPSLFRPVYLDNDEYGVSIVDDQVTYCSQDL